MEIAKKLKKYQITISVNALWTCFITATSEQEAEEQAIQQIDEELGLNNCEDISYTIENTQESDMGKLLLVDKDGTLVSTRSGEKSVSQPWDQKPLPGAKEVITYYYRQGWKIVIISNPRVMAERHKSLENYSLEMQFCMELFPEISEAFFCPDLARTKCYRIQAGENCLLDSTWTGEFHQPNPGMLLTAKHIYGADECLMVSDRLEDEKIAEEANISFIAAAEWRSLNPA